MTLYRVRSVSRLETIEPYIVSRALNITGDHKNQQVIGLNAAEPGESFVYTVYAPHHSSRTRI